MDANALTIRALRTTPVVVPMARPLGTSAQKMHAAPLLLLDLETEQGITGLAYLFCYTPMGMGLMRRVLEEAAESLKGERISPAQNAARLHRHFRLIGVTGVIAMAVAALDVAFWDALAKAAGVPLVRLLGGDARPVPAYNSNGLGLMSPEAAAQEAEALLEGGFRAVKLRLGYPTLSADIAAVRSVRKRLPGAVELMVDYNQALTVDEALDRGRALDSERLAWIEEPVCHDDYTGCARLAGELATPIQIGENFAGPRAMSAALAAGAADCVMPDLARIGGVSGWQQAASLAASAGIPISSHLYPEFSVHLLAASPTCHWLEYVDWAVPVLARPLQVTSGTVTPPDRPGTGVEWDEDAVARYRAE